MALISIELPETLHEILRETAEREGITIEAVITRVVGERLSISTEYLSERAKHASREKFRAALASIPDDEPAEYDRL